MTSRRAWTGENDRGSTDFSPAQRDDVIRYLRTHQGREQGRKMRDIATILAIDGRTLRSIFHDIDGSDLVIGYDGVDRVFMARTTGEAESFTRRLESQAKKMLQRVARRRGILGDERSPQLDLFGE